MDYWSIIEEEEDESMKRYDLLKFKAKPLTLLHYYAMVGNTKMVQLAVEVINYSKYKVKEIIICLFFGLISFLLLLLYILYSNFSTILDFLKFLS